jgi:hypothetical protein
MDLTQLTQAVTDREKQIQAEVMGYMEAHVWRVGVACLGAGMMLCEVLHFIVTHHA